MTMPIKVLVLNSCVNGGGAGRSLEASLSVADPRLSPVVAMPAPGVIAAKIAPYARLVYVPEFVERMTRSPYAWPDRLHVPWLHLPANLVALTRAIDRLVAIATELRPQVIYCNHMLAKPVGVAVGARTGIPVVFHSRACHALWIDAAFYRWLGRREAVARIICNSEASAAVYRRHSDAKVTIVPNGIDVREFSAAAVATDARAEFGIGRDEFVVGFVGRIHERKGLDWLLRSFARFADGRRDVRLLVVGGNDSSLRYDAVADYRSRATRLGVGDRVVFAGYRDDVRPLVAAFDALAMPSILPESFGRVLLEAMAFAKPAIISAHGGATEVVRNGDEGLWVPVGDDDALAAALDKLYADPQLRARMGAAGRRRVEACYDRTAIAHRIADVLVEVARGGAPAAGGSAAVHPPPPQA
jgi:glycosyltransferase involved in cell wall biosynthesis